MTDLDLKVGNRVYPIEYIKASRRTSSVRIRNGRVVLKLSRFLRNKERDQIIEKFLKWASGKLSNMREFTSSEYKDGGRIVVHNKIYEISVIEENRKSFRACLKNGCLIEIRVPYGRLEKVRFLCEKMLIKDQTLYLNQVIEELNELYVKGRVGLVRFKRMQSRFGSCSRNGNISIALSVLFMPREIFRYVCLHELAHLKEFNHSKRFWAIVEEGVPGYKVQRKWLKKNGFLMG